MPSDEELHRLASERAQLVKAREQAATAADTADDSARELAASDMTITVLDAETKARTRVTKAETERDAKKTQLSDMRTRLEDSKGVKELKADVTKAVELAAALTAAIDADELATEASISAMTNLDDLEADEQRLRAEFGEARDHLSTLSPPRPGQESLLADWTRLTTWAAAKATELLKAHTDESTRATTLRERYVTTKTSVFDLAEPLRSEDDGLGDSPLPIELHTFVLRLHERALSRVDEVEENRDRRIELKDQIDRLKEDRAVATELGSLLTVRGFERWLLEEVIADLVQGATARLLDLSGGQYSLATEGIEIRVRDHHNADELRDVKSLSGGETFLASLALALGLADALAEMASDASPVLDSIFLDEGFGTLDPETLDVVAAAIEELGATGRMVGIVTHIRELADRMPTRFEVSKGATSSTVERVDV